MNDYLTTLAIRMLRPTETLQPRRGTIFEPPPAMSGVSAVALDAGMPEDEQEDDGVRPAAGDAPVPAVRFRNDMPWRLDRLVPPAGATVTRKVPALHRDELETGAEPSVTAYPLKHAVSAAPGASAAEMPSDEAVAEDRTGGYPAMPAADHAVPPRPAPDVPHARAISSGSAAFSAPPPPRITDEPAPVVDPARGIQARVDAAGRSRAVPAPPRVSGRLSDGSPDVRNGATVRDVLQPASTGVSLPPALVPREESRREAPPEPATVRVTIGRIDVRAIMPEAPFRQPPPSAKPDRRLSLGDYLRTQKRGYR